MPKDNRPSRQICPACKGKSWKVVQKTRIKNGKVVSEPEHEPCPTCAGTGWTNS